MPWPESFLRTEKLFSGQGFYQNIFWEYFFFFLNIERDVSLSCIIVLSLIYGLIGYILTSVTRL